jgi:EAL domain-containing protein (putative c-di-GMP-specific phosphodiesterase class I)
MVVNYQPVIDLASGKVAKVEVLTRSEAPGQSIAEMVRSAEKSGDIKKMTDRIIETALAEWHKFGRADIGISINLSLQNLDEKDLPKRVVRALKKHRVDPKMLWFEIDEKAQKLTNGLWLARMRELASAGVRFSVDSFGAGELSQATVYDLDRMPIAELKIDGQVVADADSNIAHRNDMVAAVQIARQLHLATSAKGIERSEIAGMVARIGITYGQGYFFARPLPIGTLASVIDTYRAPIAGLHASP